jgi:DNA-binding response OmpR family regulator
MPDILIVDDEEMIRRLIRKYAEFYGYDVWEAVDGMEAVSLCKRQKFDIVIMDIMMPELDGFSASKMIRSESDVPIIMLSARGEEYDKVRGFEIGVDDYVVKPFSPKELMLRVAAVLKRCKKSDDGVGNEIVKIDGITADVSARAVYVDGARVEMSPKEYDLFFYMLKNKNIALSREKLITEVWGFDYYGDDRTLDTHIKLLRKSLGKYATHIVTLRSVGYRFDV